MIEWHHDHCVVPPAGLDQLGGVYRQPVAVLAGAVQRLQVDDVTVLGVPHDREDGRRTNHLHACGERSRDWITLVLNAERDCPGFG
ncbi:hypothetical protein Aru02nite_10560 [Actinocatenispora rupis]|uniref:Uncharacterized protein n=1 Tax=Actinocatenispora rupis TaxID=519421 RepID=A0A8J3J4U9_9ACTN|nr:hypothetical protein Aru02nite_10560 [Actinocatenispora rupis]